MFAAHCSVAHPLQMARSFLAASQTNPHPPPTTKTARNQYVALLIAVPPQ